MGLIRTASAKSQVKLAAFGLSSSYGAGCASVHRQNSSSRLWHFWDCSSGSAQDRSESDGCIGLRDLKIEYVPVYLERLREDQIDAWRTPPIPWENLV